MPLSEYKEFHDEKLIIRPAQRKDCETIANLIKELAVYEKMPDQAKLTGKDLERDAFDVIPAVVNIIVAESTTDKEILGYALYFYNYSAWTGKAIHMEDLYVKSEHRFKGIGEKILRYLGEIADKGNYPRISFECVDWNEQAIKFYTKHGAEDITKTQNWHSYRFVHSEMKKLASL